MSSSPKQNPTLSKPLGIFLSLAVGIMLIAAIPLVNPPNDAATFVTLGTGGGPIIRAERSEPANAVVVGKAVYLFDVGNGVQRQMVRARLPLAQVRVIFVSHHHVDHNADLGPVLVERWLLSGDKPLPVRGPGTVAVVAALPVLGPPGTVAMVAALAAGNRATELAPTTEGGPPKPSIASTVAAKDLPADLNASQVVYQDENIKVLAVTNTHYHFASGSEEQRFARSYSYRIETARRVFVFTGDTGVSDHVEALAKGADVLVSEVIDLAATEQSMKASGLSENKGLIAHIRQDHLTPTQIGEMAQRAGVKEVVLTHLSPGLDGEKDLSGYVRGLNTSFKGPVHVARDLDRWY